MFYILKVSQHFLIWRHDGHYYLLTSMNLYINIIFNYLIINYRIKDENLVTLALGQ
jgi:hypothetical protein